MHDHAAKPTTASQATTTPTQGPLQSGVRQAPQWSTFVRPQLEVNQPGDLFEQEADRVAEAVVAAPDPAAGNPPDDEEVTPASTAPPIQRRDDGAGAPAVSAAVERTIAATRGGGSPLPHSVQQTFAPRFGVSLASVRVHTGPRAAGAARDLQAKAFTTGNDIYFGAGQFRPDTQTGRRLLAHEVTHTIQQRGVPAWSAHRAPLAGQMGLGAPPAIQRQPQEAVDEMERVIAQAKKDHTGLERLLNEVTVRLFILSDRSVAKIAGEGKFVYPSAMMRGQQGYYLIRWQSNGMPDNAWDLRTGAELTRETAPDAHVKAGFAEWVDKRKQRIGVIWFSRTVDKPPEPRPPTADELEFPLQPQYELSKAEFDKLLEQTPPKPLVIPGVTGGIFYPDYQKDGKGAKGFYGKPFNFTYYTHDGMYVWLSRTLVDREFYYVVPIQELQDFMRFYPIEYAGKAAAGMAMLAQIMVDVAISFIPVVGPLYGLAMASVTAYQAYKNWDKMTGWEKALVGATVLLSVIPAIRAGRNIVRGATAYNAGVNSLVASGLTKAEARNLMIMSTVFQSEKSALRVVDTLGDALRRGERLTAAELAQLESVFQKMLQQLPAAERSVIAAGFATRNVNTAREFFRGVELSERHLAGLRKLAPETLAAFQKLSKSHPEVVQRVALWAERSSTTAAGINAVQGVVKPSHLVYVVGAAGEDMLEAIGRGGVQLDDALIQFVQKARSPSDAYRRLMQGTTAGGRNIKGLSQLLQGAREQALAPALASVEQQFSRVFLTVPQLEGLARIDSALREALATGSESQVRTAATIANLSGDAAKGMNEIGGKLLAKGVSGERLGQLFYDMGGGLVENVGRLGIEVSDDLAKAVAGRRGAVDLLLRGRGGRYPVTGLLDEMATKLGKVSDLERALPNIRSGRYQAELFARWAVQHPQLTEGIDAIVALRPADAQEKIKGIFQAVGGDIKVARDFFSTIGQVYKESGTGVGLERMIAELGAGAEKTMGASLTMSFAIRRLGGKIAGFEVSVAREGVERVYDLVAPNGLHYEFKFWTTFGGTPAAAAADEFARDVILHAATNFKQLKWVISQDAAGHLPAIESMMRGVLSRPKVREALVRQGLTADGVLAELEGALAKGLIEFF